MPWQETTDGPKYLFKIFLAAVTIIKKKNTDNTCHGNIEII